MKLEAKMETELITLEKLILMVYNKPNAMILELFEERHPSYREEQRDRMQNDFGKWWSMMDTWHRIKALEVAESYYSNEAKKRVQNW